MSTAAIVSTNALSTASNSFFDRSEASRATPNQDNETLHELFNRLAAVVTFGGENRLKVETNEGKSLYFFSNTQELSFKENENTYRCFTQEQKKVFLKEISEGVSLDTAIQAAMALVETAEKSEHVFSINSFRGIDAESKQFKAQIGETSLTFTERNGRIEISKQTPTCSSFYRIPIPRESKYNSFDRIESSFTNLNENQKEIFLINLKKQECIKTALENASISKMPVSLSPELASFDS